MATQDRSEIGMERMIEVMGPEAKNILKSFEKISPDFTKHLKEFVWGELYQRRSSIDDKTRLVACFAALMGQGNTDIVIRRYIRTMLSVGWERNEIIEIIILMIAYVGFPTATETLYIAQEIFSEIDKEK